MLAPGDKVIVASGRYTEPLIASKSGTAKQPIRIVGVGRPLIEAEGIASGSPEVMSKFPASRRTDSGGRALELGWASEIITCELQITLHATLVVQV